MSQESLGLIETIGLAAAIAAADAAVKSANVTLVGYELTKGDGMTVVKLRGDVGAIKAAVSAAEMEAGRVGRVVATRVIARPANDLTRVVDTRDTVGAERRVAAKLEPDDVEAADQTVDDEPAVEAMPASDAIAQTLPDNGVFTNDAGVSTSEETSAVGPAVPDAAPAAGEPVEPLPPQPPRPPSRPGRHNRRR